MTSIKQLLRRILSKLHIYVGLTLGLLLSIICLSGVLIVYKPELEKLSIPELARIEVPKQGQRLPLQQLLEATQVAYPNYTLENMVLYGGPNEAYSFRSREHGRSGRVQIYINQYTGEVLGADRYSSKWMQWLYDLHVSLFIKKSGKQFVGIFGLVLICLSLSGLVLLVGRYWRVLRVQSRNARTQTFRWHNLIGLYSLPFVLLIAFTGAYWGMPNLYRAAFESIGEGRAIVPAPEANLSKDLPLAALDEVLATAQKAFPEGMPTMIFLPQGKKTTFSVRMRASSDYARTGNNHIYIAPHTAELAGTNLWRDKGSAEKLTRSMYFLHFGEFGGHTTRVLWMLLGLSVPLLYITGVYLWWSKRRRRSARPD